MRLIALAAAALLIAGPAEAQRRLCTVDDPSDTPLNLRAAPNGRILGAINNGVDVLVVQVVTDARGRAWAQVRTRERRPRTGWVFRRFIYCG